MSKLSKDDKTQWFLFIFWPSKVVISISWRSTHQSHWCSRHKSTGSYGDSDVCDLKLMAICGCWWLNFDVSDIFWMLVKKIMVHYSWILVTKWLNHLMVFTNTLSLQHSSPKSMSALKLIIWKIAGGFEGWS